eukprot:321220-Rhodomonas_salina.1
MLLSRVRRDLVGADAQRVPADQGEEARAARCDYTPLTACDRQDVPCTWMDAREVLIVESSLDGLGEKGSASTGGVTPLWDVTSKRVINWWSETGKAKGFHDLDYAKQTPIVVVTGFVAITEAGVPTTLKRSGSDYSATIFAKLMSASRVT